jgi:hypothetical protein
MTRNVRIALLCLSILVATVAAAFSLVLIQNYRSQFDMEMTYAEMTRHVRAASVALSLFVLVGGLASWSLVRVLKRPRP